MLIESFVGIVLGAALMFAVRQLAIGIYFVPIAVIVGPLLLRARGRTPSKVFLILYIVLASMLFLLLALTSPGFLRAFDPP